MASMLDDARASLTGQGGGGDMLAEARTRVGPQPGAAGGAAVGDLMARMPPVQRRSWMRPAAQGAGAVVGGITGIPGGVRGMVTGATTGAGLAGTGYDVATGQADTGRLAAETIPVVALQATPLGQGLSTGKAILGSGLATTLGGQLYDLGKSVWTGKYRTPSQVAGSTAEDLFGGATGEMMTRAQLANPARASRISRRQDALANQAEQRQAFEAQGITPRASEITGSKGVAFVEGIPEKVPAGSGRPQAFEELRNRQAARAAQGQVSAISPRGITSETQAGTILQHDLAQQKEVAEGRWNESFRKSEAVTGDDPVVPTTNFNDALTKEMRLGRVLPSGTPGYVSRMRGALSQEDEATTMYRTLIDDMGFSPDVAQQIVQHNIGTPGGPPQALPISFKDARAIESELGALGYRGRPPVGASPGQRKAGRLYGALVKDLQDFYATTEGQQVHPLLQSAKEDFKEGLRQYNDSIVADFTSRHGTPEQAIRKAFIPGNVTDTVDVQSVASKEAWDAAAQGWLQGLYDQAMDKDTGVFSLAKFKSAVRLYDRNGHLDYILGQERANQLRDLTKVYGRMGASEKARGNPSQTSHSLLARAQLGSALVIPQEVMAGIMAGHPLGGAGAAAGTAATSFGVPMALGRMSTTPRGINFLTNRATPGAPLSPMALRALGLPAGMGLTP